MDLDSRDSTGSPEMPPAPSPPVLSYSDTYRTHRRSSTPDKRRRRRSSSRSRSPSRPRSYRRSRSSERDRDRDRDRERDRDRDRERDRDRDRDRERDRDRDRSKRYSKRDRSWSKSRSRSRSQSNEKVRNHSKASSKEPSQKHPKDNRRHQHRSTGSNVGSSSKHLYAPVVVQPQFPVQPNAFKNDGSFMEMFKKMQEQMPVVEPQPTTSVLEEKPVAPPPLMVGKRRGGRILKTGMVAKPKAEQPVEQPKDAWSLYMAEVKKYREVCCQEEDNTRPLVK
ncbi:hypothetical protein TSAR_000165 [Trichomalopsis sarcophagae]|uniref:Uncharacterized protein n=1 Tax=Trichomalopsis sarcophagae TaxID=543379 RepID=A0A232F1Q8_9HYME|nr:hypothetical protein TSAR_000165 [Trichomalopsis sarcophagae]